MIVDDEFDGPPDLSTSADKARHDPTGLAMPRAVSGPRNTNDEQLPSFGHEEEKHASPARAKRKFSVPSLGELNFSPSRKPLSVPPDDDVAPPEPGSAAGQRSGALPSSPASEPKAIPDTTDEVRQSMTAGPGHRHSDHVEAHQPGVVLPEVPQSGHGVNEPAITEVIGTPSREPAREAESAPILVSQSLASTDDDVAAERPASLLASEMAYEPPPVQDGAPATSSASPGPGEIVATLDSRARAGEPAPEVSGWSKQKKIGVALSCLAVAVAAAIGTQVWSAREAKQTVPVKEVAVSPPPPTPEAPPRVSEQAVARQEAPAPAVTENAMPAPAERVEAAPRENIVPPPVKPADAAASRAPVPEQQSGAMKSAPRTADVKGDARGDTTGGAEEARKAAASQPPSKPAAQARSAPPQNGDRAGSGKYDYSLAPQYATPEDRRRAEEQLEIIRALRRNDNP